MEHEQLKAEAHRIALDVMSRRRAGEPLTDDDVLSQQPNELRPYLREELRKVALVQQAGALAMGGPPDPRPGDTLQRDFASDAEAEQDIRITTVEPDVDVRRTMRSTWKDTVHEEDAEDWRAAGFGSNGDAASAPIPASEEPAEEIGWDLVDEPAVEIEANSPSASREDAGFLLDDESESPLPAEAAAPESPWTDPGASIDLQPVAEGPPHVPDDEPTTPSPPEVAPTAPPQPFMGDFVGEAAARYRPVARPATPLLRVLDDQQATAEVLRIRQTSFVIGGRLGDLVVGHDTQIDPVHAEIRYEPERGRWLLRDLNSRTGTYVRVQRLRLRSDDWVMLGRTHLQFRQQSDGRPYVRVVSGGDSGSTFDFSLDGMDSALIGREGRCDLTLPDVLLNPRHARLVKDPQHARWFLEDLQTTNGVWASVRKVPLQRDSIFQVGEQRFIFST